VRSKGQEKKKPNETKEQKFNNFRKGGGGKKNGWCGRENPSHVIFCAHWTRENPRSAPWGKENLTDTWGKNGKNRKCRLDFKEKKKQGVMNGEALRHKKAGTEKLVQNPDNRGKRTTKRAQNPKKRAAAKETVLISHQLQVSLKWGFFFNLKMRKKNGGI